MEKGETVKKADEHCKQRESNSKKEYKDMLEVKYLM